MGRKPDDPREPDGDAHAQPDERRLGAEDHTERQPGQGGEGDTRHEGRLRGCPAEPVGGDVAAPPGERDDDGPDQQAGQRQPRDRPPPGRGVVAELTRQRLPDPVLGLVDEG
jgi:hypothetical protein